MRCQKSKRAFTLVEMVIAIVVVAVVFSMVTIMSVSISGYSKEKTLITERHEEITRAQSFLKNWTKSLDDAFNTKFQLNGSNQIYIQSGLFWDVDPNNQFVLNFDHLSKTLSGEFYINHTEIPRAESFRHIKDMHFTLGAEDSAIGNTVKCKITMDDESEYVILMEKESSKTGISVIFNGPFEKKNGSNNEFVFVTSADWDKDLSQSQASSLQDIANLAPYDFSAAYHYAAMSMLQVQIDQQARMSLEAFGTAYDVEWKVSIFNAAGKIAYRMTLPNTADFNPSNHRLSFFIQEGSVLYDGSPVDPMGYTRKEGGIGTTDWHDAAELTFVKQSTSGNIWWLEFDTNIQWDEMDATQYTKLQYSTVRKLYGMNTAFGLGIDDGIFITIDDVRVPLSVYANQNKVEVEMNNQGENGTVRIRLGLNNMVPNGKTVAVTFSTKFHLPDGTPLREENVFLCKAAKAAMNKAVSITAGGEYDNTSDGMFYMWFYVNTPWTDTKTTKYDNMQNVSSAANMTDDLLTEEALNYFYDRIFIGKDGAEKSLRIAKDEYKLKISLEKHDDERMLLTLAIKKSDMSAAGYPFNFEDNTFSIRFGVNSLQNNNLITKQMILPNGVPVRFGALARIKGELGKASWLARQTLSLAFAPTKSNNNLYITVSTNSPWIYQSGQAFNNVLTNNQGMPKAFIQSLKNKVKLTIGGETKTLAGWGTGTVDVNVLQQNGCMAMQIIIKSGKANNKAIKLDFQNGFVGPDGTTLAVPAEFSGSGNGGDGWESSTNGNLFFPKRYVSIVSTAAGTYSASVTVKSAALNGTAPYYIYARIKLENAKSLGSGAAATIKLDFASSADKTITLSSDTGDWIKLVELNAGIIPSMNKEDVTITFQMYNMSGTLTVADLVIADKNGNIKYSMANDTTLYGVGDVRNVNNVNSTKSSWTSSNPDNKAKFPIITRGDSNYLPNRILKLTVPSGFTGEYANLLIDPKKFTQGTTYYITGRIRATLSNNPSSNATNVLLSGAGTTQKYGVQNGEWVALAQPNGDPLTFTGGYEETPITTLSNSAVHRSIGISCKNNTRNAKLVIDKNQFVSRYGSGTFVVHGYYKVTSYRANDFVTDDSYTIGGNATGAINKKGNQAEWTYFRVIWNTSTNLDFQFWHATGGLYIANLTVEDANHNRKYDMAMDTELIAGYHPINQPDVAPITQGVWYIYPFPEGGNHSDVTMDVSVGAVKTTSTPLQYSVKTDITKISTISSPHRTLGMSCKNNARNAKVVIDHTKFNAKYGAGTYIVRGYYMITDFRANDGVSDASYTIGGNATGAINKSGNQSTWTLFEVTWNSANANLDFQFWHATGGLYIANLTVERSNRSVVYDMAKDTELTEGYKTVTMPNPQPLIQGIWYAYAFAENGDHCSITMDVLIGAAKTTATPKQYTYKAEEVPNSLAIGSGKRWLAIVCRKNMINGQMKINHEHATVKAWGANRNLIVRGYYRVTDYGNVTSSGSLTIAGNSSNPITVKGNVSDYTYFKTTWNTNNDLTFSFWMAYGTVYLCNLTIEDASTGAILYDLSSNAETPGHYSEHQKSGGSFSEQLGIWWIGAFTNASYPTIDMQISIESVTSSTPKQYSIKETYTKISTISTEHRKISIGAKNNLKNAKMVLLADKFKAKFGAADYIVRGYYKIESYKANDGAGSDHYYTIGANATSGSVKKTGNVTSWTYFELKWNPNSGKNLDFQFWNATGYIHIANLTVEKSNRSVTYDMGTDTNLANVWWNTEDNNFPQYTGTGDIWYFNPYGIDLAADRAVMNISPTAVKTSDTPKQYTVKETITVNQTLSSVHRQMGIGSRNNLKNAKMVLLANAFKAQYGAADYTVRGYYKVVNYKANDGVTSDHYYTIGANATSGSVKATGNQDSWKYFELKWNPNSGKDLDFQFWQATGTIYIANLTVEKAGRAVVYDMAKDSALKEMWLSTNHNLFPQYSGINNIWYFNPYGISSDDKAIMNVSTSDVKTSRTPEQYTAKWDYIKLAIGNNPGTVEIADLQIYYVTSSGSKVYVYQMSTDSAMATNKNNVNNTNNSIGSTLWPYTWGSQSVPFKYSIINNNITTPPDTDFVVPKFTETAG